MAAVLAGLKSVDFYRKLKRDLQQELTEASIAGAALVRNIAPNGQLEWQPAGEGQRRHCQVVHFGAF